MSKVEVLDKAITLVERKFKILDKFPKAIFSKEREVFVIKYKEIIDSINEELVNQFIYFEDELKQNTEYKKQFFGYGDDRLIDVYDTMLQSDSSSFFSDDLFRYVIKELKKYRLKVINEDQLKIESPKEKAQNDAFAIEKHINLKPSFMGIEVDLNFIVKWISSKFKKKT